MRFSTREDYNTLGAYDVAHTRKTVIHLDFSILVMNHRTFTLEHLEFTIFILKFHTLLKFHTYEVIAP